MWPKPCCDIMFLFFILFRLMVSFSRAARMTFSWMRLRTIRTTVRTAAREPTGLSSVLTLSLFSSQCPCHIFQESHLIIFIFCNPSIMTRGSPVTFKQPNAPTAIWPSFLKQINENYFSHEVTCDLLSFHSVSFWLLLHNIYSCWRLFHLKTFLRKM